MEVFETIKVDTVEVGCDGGGGALGHPLIYMELLPKGSATCPYCSRHFVLNEGAKAASGGN